jgi:hypothetical protein
MFLALLGDGINSIIEALRKRQDRIRYIAVRHEEISRITAVCLDYTYQPTLPAVSGLNLFCANKSTPDGDGAIVRTAGSGSGWADMGGSAPGNPGPRKRWSCWRPDARRCSPKKSAGPRRIASSWRRCSSDVLVSHQASCSDLNLAPFSARACRILSKSRVDLANRSSRETISVSPASSPRPLWGIERTPAGGYGNRRGPVMR